MPKAPSEAGSSVHTDPADDLLDKFSPLRVAKIFPVNYKRKPLVIEDFRPKPNKCLDYHLSETNVRWNVGDTKVRAKHIIADYVLAPPGYVSKKPPIYSTGSGPCWKWLDEIWREKMERRNAKYKAMFAGLVHTRRTKVIRAKSKLHELLYELAGPPWFQELSCRQLMIMNNLQWCIEMDIHLGTIDYTKDNLAQFGLMLRANSKAIKIALSYCCGNDVEFLLILYQISNPKRTDYSINDRLLLSAVYHLTIIETLRELHVRIPSPPRKEKKKMLPEIRKKPKKEYYCSPYLEPYTFERDPPKHTGIFKKNWVQYPESPYFCYVDDLHEDIANAGDSRDINLEEIEDLETIEILEDMQRAQTMYNRLPHKIYKNLVPPTIKDRCHEFDEYFKSMRKSTVEHEELAEVELPPLAELTSDHEIPCTCDKEDTDKVKPICCPNDMPCECPEEECDCKRSARLHMQAICKRCDLQKRYKQRIVMSGSRCIDGNLVPIIGGFYKERECSCMQKYHFRWDLLDKAEEMGTEKVKYNISGICYTPVGAFYIIKAAITPSYGFKAPKLGEGANKPCGRAICTCAEMEDLMPKDLVEVPIPETRQPPEMPWEKAHCRCRQELKKFLALQCNCQECEEIRRLENRDTILGGLKALVCPECTDTQGYDALVPINLGIQDLHCDCLERYKEHIQKLEEYKQRVKARITLKAQENKFAIGGVTQTKDGPVYQIQGLRTPLKCICAEVDAEMRAEEEEKKRMPKMPPSGRTRYAIAGVYAGDSAAAQGAREEGENLFILSQALGQEPCKCHKLYEVFEEEHKNCMDYFEEYMKKTMDDIVAMEMEEAEKRRKKRLKEERQRALDAPDEEEYEGVGPCAVCGAIPCTCICPCQEEEKPDNFDSRPFVHPSSSSSSGSNLFSIGSNKCDCALEVANMRREEEMMPCEPCNKEVQVCPEPPPKEEPIPEPPPKEPEPRRVEPEDTEVYDLKRFVILEKIPCDFEKMQEILKKVLETMAGDGFPLAKLPECHKLPIMKLWMCMRCGKHWTEADRPLFNELSALYRSHNDACFPNIPFPTVPISKKKAKTLTWKNFEYVRGMVDDMTESYYRQIKKETIDSTRELFPAFFNYEFPEFRHTIFCYLPSKEEDIILKSSHRS